MAPLNNMLCATRRNRVMNRSFSCLNRRFLCIKKSAPYKKEGWLYLNTISTDKI